MNALKRMLAAIAVIAASFLPAIGQAETYFDGTYTWTYSTGDDGNIRIGADVEDEWGNILNWKRAVDPQPTGNVTIPPRIDGRPVTEIGTCAFYYCWNMTSVVVPEGVWRIGRYAFENCSGLTSVQLPSTLEEIDSFAFTQCNNLLDLFIPAGVVYITEGAFDSSYSGLTGLVVSEENEFYSSEGGVLYDKKKETVYYWPHALPVNIPSSVRRIADLSFHYIQQTDSIVIPEGVTNIGAYAFQGSHASGYQLPDSLRRIEYASFSNNENLRYLVIPPNVTYFSGNMWSCPNLTTIFFKGNAPDYAYYGSSPNRITTFVPEGSTGWNSYGSTELPESWPMYDTSADQIRHWPNPPEIVFLVTFDLGEGATRSGGGELEQVVRDGQSAVAPELALNSGYEFVGWDKPFDCVSNSMTVAAIYRKDGKLLDGKNYTEKVGDYTWTFSVENGEATIVHLWKNADGSYSENGPRAVEPQPQGELTIPATLGGCPVVGLGYNALNNCYNMSSVILPDALRIIGRFTFQSCNSMTQIEIPASVEVIGEGVFNSCSQLRNLTVANGNPHYTSDDGVLYNKTKETIYFWPRQKAIEIPGGVCNIGPYAFYDNHASQDQAVILPSSVTNIGEYAFASRYDLADVTLNEGLVSIGDGAFMDGYNNLRAIVIPSTVKSIGGNVFAYCSKLSSVFFAGNAPEYAGTYLYHGAPAGLTTFVRSGSTGWKTAGRSELPEQWPALDEWGNGSPRPIETWTTYPDLPAMHTVTFVAGNHGYISSGATQTVLDGRAAEEPEVYVNDWEGFEFTGWSEDTSVVTEDMTVFAEYERENSDGSVSRVIAQDGYQWEFVVCDGEAVIGCANADGSWNWGRAVYPDPSGKLTIPSELGGWPVVGISFGALESCGNLTAVTIPAGVTWIGNGAFRSCWRLQTVEFEGDEKSIYISSDAFKGTPYEASLPFELIIEEDGEDKVVTSYRGLIPSELVIPDGVTGIGEYVFEGAIEWPEEGAGERTVKFPSTLRWIGEGAFNYCYGLDEIVLPEGLERIGAYAFAECYGWIEVEVGEDEWVERIVGLSRVTIPSTVKEIGEGAFIWCQALETVNFAGNEDNIEVGAFAFNFTPFERDRPFELVIRDNVVVAIHGQAPEEVEIPDGVEAIGPYALAGGGEYYCTMGLRRMTLPASVTNIGDHAFAYSGLRHVIIRDEGEVSYDDLMERTGLTVDESAFHRTGYCDGWELPYFEIDENGCLGLTWEWGYDDVGGCVTNGVMRVPEGVREIGEWFFASEGEAYDEGWNLPYPNYTDELTTLYLPASLERIGEYAFAYCQNLAMVVYAGDATKVDLGRGAFIDTPYAAGLPFRLLTDGTTVTGFIGGPVPEVLEISAGMTAIATSAFDHDEYRDAVLPLQKVVIPASVTNIGNWAFYDCRNLAELEFRGDVGKIVFGSSVFSGTPYGETIRQPFLRISGTILEGVEWQYRYDGTKGCVTNGIIKVPQGVTEIGRSALSGLGWDDASGFRRVELSASVRRVDEYAFRDCRKLEEVTFAATNLVFDSTAFCWSGKLGYVPSETLKSVRLVSPDAKLAGWKLVARPGADKSKEKTFAADDLGAFAGLQGYDVVPILGEGSSEEEEGDVTTYTVTFDANGGEGTMGPQLLTNGVAQALATNCFTFAGKLFAGWATNATTEAVYADGEAVRDLASAGGTFALFATWADDPSGNRNAPIADPQLRGDDLKPVETPVAALTYSGYVTEGEEIVGLITVKVSKKGAVTATVQLPEGTKLAKTSYKGTLGKGGKAELVCSKNGGAMSALVCEGLVSGTIEVGKGKLGFTACSGAKDVLADLDGFGGKVWTVALKTAPAKGLPELMNGYSVLSVAGGKKGKMKVSGVLADGTKVSATAQGMAFGDSVVVPVVYRKKTTAFSLKLILKEKGGVQVGNVSAWTSGSEEAAWEKAIASEPDNVKAGAKFGLDEADIPESFDVVDAAKGKKSILPNGVPVKAVDASSGKWTLPKAGKVAFVRGSTDLDETKFTAKGETDPNPAGLKLTFKKKTGLFSGSFQFYQPSGAKLKKLKAAVNGAVVDGKGYGSATVKNMGALPVTVGK